MTTRCALYLRVSTDDGRQTTENQRAEVEQLVRARCLEPVLYQEMASAAKHRPVFERLMTDVRAGRVHAVAAWSLDRIGRGFACFDTFRELAGSSCASSRCVSRGSTRTDRPVSCSSR